MLYIKNLTNSPYEIIIEDGCKEIVPARGEIIASVHPNHLQFYRSLGYFVIEEVASVEEDVASVDEQAPVKRGRPRKEK